MDEWVYLFVADRPLYVSLDRTCSTTGTNRTDPVQYNWKCTTYVKIELNMYIVQVVQ